MIRYNTWAHQGDLNNLPLGYQMTASSAQTARTERATDRLTSPAATHIGAENNAAREGWVACKQKVLELIEKYTSETSEGNSVIFVGHKNKFVEEIEEL